jgi:ribosomal protein L11 methyltransferase
VTALWRVSMRVPSEGAEELRAAFVALAPQGFEEREAGESVELALYVDAERLEGVQARLPGASVEPVRDGWEEAWRAFHRPIDIEGIWIGPPWELAPDPGRAVVIDPGRAFGTGAHPTTQLCVALLARVERQGSLLDVGCGSGVLGIVGARLGFAPVTCVDVDPVAVESAIANAAANGARVAAQRLDALRDELPAADTAVANVLLEPVERILARLQTREAITSGYLAGERPAHPGWTHVDTVELEGWAADRFRRAATADPGR